MICLARILSPIAAIEAGSGPTQVRPAASTARAKSAFSERNPYPGWTASAPERRAASRSRSARRYVSAGASPGRRTATSASPTYGSPASASLWTATVAMPRLRQVRKTREAISARLATSSVRIMGSTYIRKTP